MFPNQKSGFWNWLRIRRISLTAWSRIERTWWLPTVWSCDSEIPFDHNHLKHIVVKTNFKKKQIRLFRKICWTFCWHTIELRSFSSGASSCWGFGFRYGKAFGLLRMCQGEFVIVRWLSVYCVFVSSNLLCRIFFSCVGNVMGYLCKSILEENRRVGEDDWSIIHKHKLQIWILNVLFGIPLVLFSVSEIYNHALIFTYSNTFAFTSSALRWRRFRPNKIETSKTKTYEWKNDTCRHDGNIRQGSHRLLELRQ